MAKPPKTPPSSDLEGVDRDLRPGVPSKAPSPDPGQMLKDAKDQSIGRPDGTPPEGKSGADMAGAGKRQK